MSQDFRFFLLVSTLLPLQGLIYSKLAGCGITTTMNKNKKEANFYQGLLFANTFFETKQKYWLNIFCPSFVLYIKTVTVNLLRDDTGLGFSIAGGRGSVPYKGNDRVRALQMICPAQLL